jgi:hypothetical protein
LAVPDLDLAELPVLLRVTAGEVTPRAAHL